MALTARTVNTQARRVLSTHLELVKGDGYCYWVYADKAGNRFGSHTVMTMRISDLSVARWLDEARGLVERMESGAC